MKLRSTIAAILGTMLLSEGAFALSCARPDLVKTLEEAKASEKLYHILAGKFVSEPMTAQDRGGVRLGPQGVGGIRGVIQPKATPTISLQCFSYNRTQALH